jgi:hypothetical protein
VPFFLGNPLVLKFGKPIAVYAMKPASENGSVRPIQTVKGIAQALGIPLNAQYPHDSYPQMAQEILSKPEYEGKMVLICWEHHVIPAIANALKATNTSKKWHGDVFDRLWILTYQLEEEVDFQDLPQRLLFGDTEY